MWVSWASMLCWICCCFPMLSQLQAHPYMFLSVLTGTQQTTISQVSLPVGFLLGFPSGKN